MSANNFAELINQMTQTKQASTQSNPPCCSIIIFWVAATVEREDRAMQVAEMQQLLVPPEWGNTQSILDRCKVFLCRMLPVVQVRWCQQQIERLQLAGELRQNYVP